MKLKKGKFLGAIVLSVFLLSSCRSLKNTNTLFQSEYDKFADTAKGVYVANNLIESDPNYRVRPFDLISIKNLQNPEGPSSSATQEIQAQTFRLDEDGVVTLPVIGKVNIKGLTQSESSIKIQNLYSKSLLKDPIVDLRVVNYKVTVLGEVNKPGNYLLERENYNLVELLGASGGLMPTADAGSVKIIRGDLQNPEIVFVNLKSINALSSKKLILRNNDIIYVAPKRLYNMSEGIKGYSTIIQPVFLVFNALLLIYTLGRK